MFITENHTLAQNQYENRIVLGNNIRSLKWYKIEFIVLLETLYGYPEVLVLTESRLSEDANSREKELQVYQSIESRHRKKAETNSWGIVSLVESQPWSRASFDWFLIQNGTLLKWKKSRGKVLLVLCVIYRPDAFWENPIPNKSWWNDILFSLSKPSCFHGWWFQQ